MGTLGRGMGTKGSRMEIGKLDGNTGKWDGDTGDTNGDNGIRDGDWGYQGRLGSWNRDGAPGAKTASQGLGLGQVVLVEQDPVLFSGTIRENIALGLEHCKESELQEAATAAGAMDFIQGLEQGWDTGESQRDTKGILGPGVSSRGWSWAGTLVRAGGMGHP